MPGALLKVPSALRRLSRSRSAAQQITRLNPTLWVTPLVLISLIVLSDYSCPFLLHIVRPALRTSPPHEGVRSLHEDCATPLPPSNRMNMTTLYVLYWWTL